MICIPVAAESMDAALADVRAASAEPADCLELRLDAIRGPVDPAALLGATELPCIATCRPVREGGAWDGDEADRLDLLRRAGEAGARWIDLEHDAFGRFAPPAGVRVIASRHDFAKTPDNLSRIVRALEALPADIVKVATHAAALDDNLRMWDAMAAAAKPVIGLCMGERGEASRVLALRQGGFLTFGSLSEGRESAPGQLTARDLAELYRVRAVTAATELYAVVGDPVAHSVSPEIHNAAFRALGMDACYLRFRVDDLAHFLEAFEPLGLRGLSVTIPHKAAALRLSDEVEPTARALGAVNTLVRRDDGGLRGENTDWQGAFGAVRTAADAGGVLLEGRTALLLGAGGAARGIAHALLAAGCRVVVANRTAGRAEALARELGVDAAPLDEAVAIARDGDCAVVANSTSVGMHPEVDATPIPAEAFGPDMVAFDAVYNPRETRMLREARERGAAIADGVAMFVGQAARQFALWTGREPPLDVMESVVARRLAGK